MPLIEQAMASRAVERWPHVSISAATHYFFIPGDATHAFAQRANAWARDWYWHPGNRIRVRIKSADHFQQLLTAAIQGTTGL